MNQVAEEILSYFGTSDSLKDETVDELNAIGNVNAVSPSEMKEGMKHSSDLSVAEEILLYFGIAQETDDDIFHYGMPRRSGRYPYGSGDNPYQHSGDFLGRVQELKKSGFTFTDENGKTWTGDNAIAKSMGLTSSEYRRQISWANYERRCLDVATAKSLKEDGLGATEIGRKMGIPESTVRSLLNPKSEDKMNQCMETVEFLRKQVDEKGIIDVGKDVNLSLGISKERLDMAVDYLEKADGCVVLKGGIPQPTNPGQQTNQKLLCLPGTPKKAAYDYENIHTVDDYVSHDGGDTFQKKFTYPASLDSKRMMIRYNEEGGLERDGAIELRRGVKDLSLGDSLYSQVRILVDGTHYMKGMAVYSDNMPDGVDVIFNTNKKKGTPKEDVLKKIKDDPDNPFGSAIKDAMEGGQYWYDPKTGERCGSDKKGAKLGLINKRADQGDWNDWADALPSQFLAKQSLPMARKQLNLAKADKLAEFDEIMKLENPTIKKHMLEKFADGCDSAAVHLKAAALPGQKYHVILPINTLKDNEVYAPNYENGTKLALIRYPHGGTFEIPVLTVNNKNALGNEWIGKKAIDAVGINHKNAEQLSGADFDGDTVMCIPTHDRYGKVKIAHKNPLKDLEGFDTKVDYGGTKTVDKTGKERWTRNGVEYPIMKDTQKQMGVISNLITDMTLGGATDSELARAVKHSMVVIDAEKHKLDYKASEIDNNIAALKKKYQVHLDEDGNIVKTGGASTILSKSKGEYTVEKRQGSYRINLPDKDYYDPSRPVGAKLWKTADPDKLYYPDWKTNKKTGMKEIKTVNGDKVIFDPKDKDAYSKYAPVKKKDPITGDIYFTDKSGTITYNKLSRTQKSTNMGETDDAYSLVSSYRHPMELEYAKYANDMKNLGNKARAEMAAAGKIVYSADAKRQYSDEVRSLDDKLKNALKNTPIERHVSRLANAAVQEKIREHPNMTKDEIKKANQQAVAKYRAELGAIARKERNIDITDNEWKAIQAGAISETTLKKILNNTDIDKLRERATPRVTNTASQAQVNRIKALAASNYTLAEIAKKTGLSTSTISKYLKGVK